MDQFISIIPLVAGGIILFSVLPRILRLVRKPGEAATECFFRALLPFVGNGLWAFYGWKQHLLMMSLTCSLGAILNGIILGFIVFELYRTRRMKGTVGRGRSA